MLRHRTVKRTMAVILAGGEGERLSILSAGARQAGGARSAASTGSSTSRCRTASTRDIDDVVVLTQYNPRSLNDHIGLGRPWDLDRNHGGVKLLQPYIARGRVAEWYRGTADAVLQNINVIEHDAGDTILILAGDHIYKMDYQPFIAAHRRQRADVTIAVRRVPARRGVADGHPRPRRDRPGHRVAGEAEAAQERPRLDGRLRLLEAGAPALARARTASTSARNVIPAMLDGGARVFGYRFDGYWQDVGTIQSYWEANMALLEDDPELDLYDQDWVIHTRSEERAPAKVGPTAQVHRSLISHGCVINGTVVNSRPVAGRAGRRRRGRARFDRDVRLGHPVGRGRRPGDPRQGGRRRARARSSATGRLRRPPNKQEPGRLNTGITVVGKRAVDPARRADRAEREGRRRTSGSTDFAKRVVTSGESVERQARRTPPPTARPRAARRRDRRAADSAPALDGGRRARRLTPAGAATRPGAPTAHRGDFGLDSAGHAIRRPGRPDRAPGRRRALARRARASSPIERADRDGITSWDLVLDGRRRFDLPRHRDPRSGVRPDLLGPLRAADQRHVPQVVPEAAALERRVPVRQVLASARTSGRCSRRAADRGAPTPTRSAWRSPAILGIADRLLDESKDWLWIGGRMPDQRRTASRRNAGVPRPLRGPRCRSCSPNASSPPRDRAARAGVGRPLLRPRRRPRRRGSGCSALAGGAGRAAEVRAATPDLTIVADATLRRPARRSTAST